MRYRGRQGGVEGGSWEEGRDIWERMGGVVESDGVIEWWGGGIKGKVDEQRVLKCP